MSSNPSQGEGEFPGCTLAARPSGAVLPGDEPAVLPWSDTPGQARAPRRDRGLNTALNSPKYTEVVRSRGVALPRCLVSTPQPARPGLGPDTLAARPRPDRLAPAVVGAPRRHRSTP